MSPGRGRRAFRPATSWGRSSPLPAHINRNSVHLNEPLRSWYYFGSDGPVQLFPPVSFGPLVCHQKKISRELLVNRRSKTKWGRSRLAAVDPRRWLSAFRENTLTLFVVIIFDQSNKTHSSPSKKTRLIIMWGGGTRMNELQGKQETKLIQTKESVRKNKYYIISFRDVLRRIKRVMHRHDYETA